MANFFVLFKNNTSNINGAVNTAHGVSTASIQVNDAYSINIDNLSDAVICAFFEGSLIINGNETISFDIFQKWIATTGTKGTSLLGSARALRNHGSADEWSNYALMAFSSSSPDSEMKLLLNELVVENCKAMSIEEEPKERTWSQPKTKKKTVRPSIVKKEFVKSKQQEKTARKTVKPVEQHRQNTPSPRGNKRNWNNMMSQKLGSNFEMFNKSMLCVWKPFNHLQKVDRTIKDYILLSLWTADPPFSQDPKSSHDDGSKPSSDDGKKVNEDPRKDSECKDQEKEDNVNSTNNVNTAGNVNTVSSTV
ncbi:hypothetical protein Tco_1210032 [Tanacetum coccineum]